MLQFVQLMLSQDSPPTASRHVLPGQSPGNPVAQKAPSASDADSPSPEPLHPRPIVTSKDNRITQVRSMASSTHVSRLSAKDPRAPDETSLGSYTTPQTSTVRRKLHEFRCVAAPPRGHESKRASGRARSCRFRFVARPCAASERQPCQTSGGHRSSATQPRRGR